MYRNVDEQLRAKMQHSEVTCLSLSFRRLGKISNLEPFINLVQLQLDNNNLRKICNLEHLVRQHCVSLAKAQLHAAPPCCLARVRVPGLTLQSPCIQLLVILALTSQALSLWHTSYSSKAAGAESRSFCWQVHLTWLDLSFNQLQEVEGLATLTRLQDLALHRNELKAIDGLAESPSLHTLSLGVAAWAHLSSVRLSAILCCPGNCRYSATAACATLCPPPPNTCIPADASPVPATAHLTVVLRRQRAGAPDLHPDAAEAAQAALPQHEGQPPVHGAHLPGPPAGAPARAAVPGQRAHHAGRGADGA